MRQGGQAERRRAKEEADAELHERWFGRHRTGGLVEGGRWIDRLPTADEQATDRDDLGRGYP